MNVMQVNIKKFKPKTINQYRLSKGPPTIAIIGKRGTGKSTLVADLLYHTRKIPKGVVMSATEESNEYYSKFVPDIFIHGEYDASAIEKIISGQRESVRSNNSGCKDCFVLLDDCMYDRKTVRDKNIRCIFMNGRHLKIQFMITMQYCMDLPPDLRANIDYVFVLRENIIDNMRKLWKFFFGIFPTFASFQEVMLSCTEGYDCMVLDNTSKSSKIEDNIFWYRAKPNRKFRIGSKDAWNYHKKRYDSNHFKKAGQASDIGKSRAKSAGIIVKKEKKKKKDINK